MGITSDKGRKIVLTADKTRKKLSTGDKKHLTRQPTWSDVIGMFVFRKKQNFDFISNSGNVQIIWWDVKLPVFKLLKPGISRVGSFLERAARNRADETPFCCIFTARCLSVRSGHEWDCQSHRDFFSEKVKRSPSNAIEAGFRWTRKLIKEYLS